MVLKVKISKAYDTVKWPFLDKVLTKFKFKGKFHRTIMSFVTTTKYVFLINGKPTWFFSMGEGMR